MSSEPRSQVVHLGLGPTAAAAYASLSGRFDVVALVRPGDDELVRTAAAGGAEVTGETSLAAVRELVERLAPDAVVVSSYDRVLPAGLLTLCPFVNVHYSPLPRYRGRANVNWMMLAGEPEAWISVHTIVPGLDAGGVLFQAPTPIGACDTVGDVYRRLDDLQREHLADAVARHLEGDPGVPQDESHATYGCTRLPEDGEIDWRASTATIDRQVRALSAPFPGAYTYVGLQVVWIDRATPVADAPVYAGRVPGRVVRVDKQNGCVDVLTGDGVLRLESLRVDGQCPVPATHVVSSVRATLGLRTIDLVRRITQLEAELTEPRRAG
ncbi:methionyl-tRNA formyltransferase [Micromonospora sp. NPDC047548]|uniref:methionyl-tRNA formyltransferase n=1 Tax=Micromonospora sp. NPDC047548 TaxID=3155624 RepID=UPI00340756C3